jgi:hypothetical protein
MAFIDGVPSETVTCILQVYLNILGPNHLVPLSAEISNLLPE